MMVTVLSLGAGLLGIAWASVPAEWQSLPLPGTPLVVELPSVRFNGVDYLLPPTRPTDTEILLRANASARTGRVRGVEVVEHRVGDPTFYPLVGVARLSSARFRCEVETAGGTRVVMIPQETLVVMPGPRRR